MTNHDGKAIVELSPDGPVSILPPALWRDGEEDPDFLGWDREHYAADGCGDCTTRPRAYCRLHRCRAIKRDGKRCGNPASVKHGGIYCSSHACEELLAIPGIFCAERPAPGFIRCGLHGGQTVPKHDIPPDRSGPNVSPQT